MADTRVRLGVVGLGAVAQAVHLPLLARLDDRFVLTALCDLSPALLGRIGDRLHVPEEDRFGDVESLVASGRVDAVAVLSSGSHGAVTLAVLDAGLPAFVEKPISYTLAEADAIAAHAGAGRLQVGYMKLYDPAVERAGAAIDAIRARGGRLRAIEVTVLHPTSESQLWQARLLPPPSDIPAEVLARLSRETDALHEAALGPAAAAIGRLYSNILLGSVVHELALIRAFDGNPSAIDAVDVWPEGEYPPSVAVTGRLPSGGRIDIRWHFLPEYAAYREIVRVVMDDSTVELEFPSPYLLNAPTRLTITDRDAEARRDTTSTSVGEAFEAELLAFHSLVVDGTPGRAGVREGRTDIVTCQRIAARYAAQVALEIGGEAAALEPSLAR